MIPRGISRDKYGYWYYWIHNPVTHLGAFRSRWAARRALRRWERWADIAPVER